MNVSVRAYVCVSAAVRGTSVRASLCAYVSCEIFPNHTEKVESVVSQGPPYLTHFSTYLPTKKHPRTFWFLKYPLFEGFKSCVIAAALQRTLKNFSCILTPPADRYVK